MVSLTRRAAEKIRNLKDGKKYLRLMAQEQPEKSNFNIAFTDEANHDDILYMSYGIKILAGSGTRKYFENLKVDYIGASEAGEFRFISGENFPTEM